LIRVGYDEQIFLLQRHGGISKYFVELIKTFKDHPELGIEPVVVSDSAINAYFFDQLKPGGRYVNSTTGALMELVIRSVLNRLSSRDVDLVHFTYYLPGYLGRFPRVPRVTTLFDMIPELVQKKVWRPWNPHFKKKVYLKNSDAVLSISESSTREMRSRYGFTFPVETSYLGVSSEYMPGIPAISSIPDKYFLYVGNRGGYKNAVTALEAFAKVAQANPELFLVFCGGGAFAKGELKELSRLGIESQVLHHNATPAELPAIYSNAVALLYPTKYEGFGLPLVEAMASGTPILASLTPINYEIANSAASYFSPDSPSELVELMQRTLTGASEFTVKAEGGLSRAKTFSWYRCAEITAKIYKYVALNGRRSR
jgi:glycosyltransferase involved in cell wall biosynthesis